MITIPQKALEIVRSLPSTPASVPQCTCGGDGWVVTLDRDRYKSPGDAGMVCYTRCVCVEQALSTTR
ncbi:MAG TPA: hypothetical protein VFM83_00930 [Gaiellaceae bacterium]|nr:hypothetical protein [Gaiellaceae bacterium]